MPLGRACGKAEWLAAIKVNKGLILGAVPKPARVSSQQPARRGSGVAARVQETGEAKGRDRGVNSAPVSPAKSRKGRAWALPLFFYVPAKSPRWPQPELRPISTGG